MTARDRRPPISLDSARLLGVGPDRSQARGAKIGEIDKVTDGEEEIVVGPGPSISLDSATLLGPGPSISLDSATLLGVGPARSQARGAKIGIDLKITVGEAKPAMTARRPVSAIPLDTAELLGVDPGRRQAHGAKIGVPKAPEAKPTISLDGAQLIGPRPGMGASAAKIGFKIYYHEG